MWFLAALFVGAFVVSLVLTPKPKFNDAVSGTLNDFNFPRASYGSPVPRWYGTCKFQAPNTIWSGDFKSVAIKKKQKTGLFSSKKVTVGFKYYVGFDLAVCLGPNFRFRRLWAGNNEIWNGCVDGCENVIDINLPELFGGKEKNGGFAAKVGLYCGSFEQSRDPYLVEKVDPNVPAYVGVAHMVFRQAYIGNSTNLQPIHVEGACFVDTLGSTWHVMPNGLDMNPVEILYDLIVNDFANLNVDAARINVVQWRAVAKRVFDENNGFSIVVANASQGGDLAREILAQINGQMFEDPATGLFDLVLIRDDYDIDDLPVLGPDEISSLSNFTKILWPETKNRVRVKFTDRANGFKENAVALAEDFANIRYQGTIRSTEATFPGCHEADLAADLAARELSNLNVPLYSAELVLTRAAANLRPGSPFVLNWPEYGIEFMVCRIRKFGLGTLRDGKVTASVVQDQFAVNATVILPPAGSGYTPPDYNPQPIVDFKLFELPYFLDYASGGNVTAGRAQFAALASRPGAASGAYNGFIVGTDGDAEVLELATYTDTATIVDPIAKFDGFVSAKLPTLTIEGLTQNGEDFPLFAGTIADVRSGRNLFMLDGEFMAYETFVDNNDGTYSLTNVHRALIDTTFDAHATGAKLFFFDGQEGFFDDEFEIGSNYQAYLVDVAASGSYPADSAARLPFEPEGRASLPLPADNLALAGQRGATQAFPDDAAPVLTFAARDALADPLAVNLESDPADAPAGVTYRLELNDANDATVTTIEPFASGDAVPLTGAFGQMTVRLWSKRDGALSYDPAEYPVFVYPTDALFIDDDLVMIDDDTIEIEEAAE